MVALLPGVSDPIVPLELSTTVPSSIERSTSSVAGGAQPTTPKVRVRTAAIESRRFMRLGFVVEGRGVASHLGRRITRRSDGLD